MNRTCSVFAVVRSSIMVGFLAVTVLSSPGCGSSDETAATPGEPNKESRVYRLSHDRLEKQIKANEAKAAKRKK